MMSNSPFARVGHAASLAILVVSLAGCRCFENCRFPGRARDVGRVQNNVGPGFAEVYPRTNVQPYSQAVLNGPAIPPTNVAQGNRLEVAGGPPIGAQVPIAAPRDGLPPGAIDPLSPNARPFPSPAVVAVPQPQPVPMVATPVPPVVPMIPTAPVVMTQPAPAAIPVVWNSPVTRSTTVPIGTAIPMTMPAVGTAPMPATGAPVPNQMMPGGLAPNYAQGGFLSGVPSGGLRLRPRAAGEPTPGPTATPGDRPRVSNPPPESSRPSRLPSDRPPIKEPKLDTPAPPDRTGSPSEQLPVPAVPENLGIPAGPADPLAPPPPKSVPKPSDPDKLGDLPDFDSIAPKIPGDAADPEP